MSFIFRIEIYTEQLLISGNYELERYQRLSDALNSDLKPFITLYRAIIGPQNRPQIAERVSQLIVERKQILFVATLKEPEPPEDFSGEQMAILRETQQVMFFTPQYGIRGTFFKRPTQPLNEALESINTTFIPLNEVHIYPYQGGKPIVRNFICLGRNHVLAAYSATDYETI
jgi:hypothetical protein